ncbi:alpha/beta fold hydrolase [Caulobacter sp. 17J80-11]|uniref:alpha/beta fold hydrolase n=1 Tax=Caulobacter sp. 17J80-11 TaxID=2763502 RepID=UPI001CA46DE6
MDKTPYRALAAVAAALFASAAAAQAPSAVEPVTPSIPADAYSPGRALVTDFDRIVAPNGVQESFIATLGGARQYVSVRGADRANPILLYVHGGPASVELPISWSFQRPWEDYFTVVEWDQRAAGKSFRLNDPEAMAPTLTPDRYRDDAIELIELLRERYGKRKIFLLGHSWGSAVGLSVAVKRPDLLYAYIGMGQLIDFQENEKQSYATVLDQARRDGNTEAVKELEGIAPYPGPGDFDVAKTGVERKWSVYYGGLAAGRRDSDFYIHMGRLSPEYGLDDRKAWDAGSDFSMTTMWPKLAGLSFEDVHTLDVPVFLFLGRHDTTTPSEIAADWLQRVKAPRKRVVWFENSSHLPMIEEPGRTFQTLLTRVRPLAGRDLPPGE